MDSTFNEIKGIYDISYYCIILTNLIKIIDVLVVLNIKEKKRKYLFNGKGHIR